MNTIFNVPEIIQDWLKSHGYDGLYNDNRQENCGCTIGEEFIPCNGDELYTCCAAYAFEVDKYDIENDDPEYDIVLWPEPYYKGYERWSIKK